MNDFTHHEELTEKLEVYEISEKKCLPITMSYI